MSCSDPYIPASDIKTFDGTNSILCVCVYLFSGLGMGCQI